MKKLSYGDVVAVQKGGHNRVRQQGVVVSLYQDASGKCLVGVEFPDGKMIEFNDAELGREPINGDAGWHLALS
jgi:hypothetical protein